MRSTTHRPSGFTIIEILVIIGIIGVLAGLLLPALGGAQRRASKGEEINRIRQVGVAWNLYANSNRDSALPGFLEDGGGNPDENVQGPLGWNVRYKLANSDMVLPDEAEEWPWRLLPYLDYDHEVILGHLEKSDTSPLRMSDYVLIDTDDPFEVLPRPIEIAQEPAFGYNAFYVGGWWEMEQPEPDLLIARPRFSNAHTPDPDDPALRGERVRVVVTSPSSIQNSSKLIVFSSSSILEPGEFNGAFDHRAGAHYVVPPIYAETRMWGRSLLTPSESIIHVESNTPVAVAGPIGRYTGQVAILHADLHTAPEAPAALDDQRFWIDVADRRDFEHFED